jgi:hypothetical protein
MCGCRLPAWKTLNLSTLSGRCAHSAAHHMHITRRYALCVFGVILDEGMTV